MNNFFDNLRVQIRNWILKILQVKKHEDLLNWLEDPDVKIARQCASHAMYGFDLKREQDPQRRMEKAYNDAQRAGCKMAGWKLQLVIYLEVAEVTRLYLDA